MKELLFINTIEDAWIVLIHFNCNILFVFNLMRNIIKIDKSRNLDTSIY
jgi:hypothetical protein